MFSPTTGILSVILLFAVPTYASISNEAVVQTHDGTVQGKLEDGVFVFHSIPFAAPPVGDFRFRSPQPVIPWQGTLNVTEVKSDCPQMPILGPTAKSVDEDCLYLNVYVPQTTNAESLPVMFWIYGGGYQFGSGYKDGAYDGKNLALKHNVIVVAPNYRVESFGLLTLPELQAEEPLRTAGNMALFDQRAGMKWTQANIQAFGGDRDRVAIFGQSAGGFSVCWHLASPESQGLFSAAIMESGSCDSPQFFRPLKESFEYGYTFAENAGCPQKGPDLLKCLRSKSAQDLMPVIIWPFQHDQKDAALRVQRGTASMRAAMAQAGMTGEQLNLMPPLAPIMPWGTTIDGTQTALPDLPLTLIEKGQFNKVPVIFGTVLNEGSYFVPALPFLANGTHFPPKEGDLTIAFKHLLSMYNTTAVGMMMPSMLSLYPLSQYKDNSWARASDVLTDYFFACGTRRSARAVASHNVPIWLYQFNYKLRWVESIVLGDYHASEVPFVFDRSNPPLHEFDAKDKEMAGSFGHYWTNMAIHGTPNAPGPQSYLNWPAYNRTGDMNMNMNVPLTVSRGLKAQRCDFWDTFEAKLRRN